MGIAQVPTSNQPWLLDLGSNQGPTIITSVANTKFSSNKSRDRHTDCAHGDDGCRATEDEGPSQPGLCL
jgi:hypothetical protein